MELWTVAGRGASGINKVDIWIGASPSHYWALLHFVDTSGKVHEKRLGHEHSGTRNSNLLLALAEAAEALNRPCMLDIHTDEDYVISAFRQGWLAGWKRNGWETAKGRPVRNMPQWQRVDQGLARHTIKLIKEERERDHV